MIIVIEMSYNEIELLQLADDLKALQTKWTAG